MLSTNSGQSRPIRLLLCSLLSIFTFVHGVMGQCTCPAQVYEVGSGHGKPLLSTSGLPSAGLTNETISICGDFSIDLAGFTLDQCVIDMEPNANLFIESGGGLSIINSSSVQNCTASAWSGIVVKSGGGIFIDEALIIEGANTAIVVRDGATAWIMSSNFDGNVRHISVTGTPNFLVANNQFSASQNVQPPFSGMPTIGIEASYATCQIGVQNFENIFQELTTYGIRAYGSALSIRGNEFKEMFTNGGPDTYAAVGVTDGSQLNMRNNDLIEVRNGVVLKQSSGNIRRNRIEGFGNGIYAEAYSIDDLLVYQNTLGPGTATDYSNRGVWIENYGGANAVHSNAIDIRDLASGIIGTYGVFIDGMGVNGPVKIAQQDQNNNGRIVVEGEARVAGVELRNIEDAEVISNDITVVSNNSATNGAGVILDGGANNRLLENNLASLSTNVVNGFFTENSSRNLYCCNTMGILKSGFHFQNMCDDSKMTQNEIAACNDGLRVMDGGIMGTQHWAGNGWTANYVNRGALNDNTDPLLITASEFIVNNNAQPVHPPDPSPGNGNWFIVLPGGHSPCGISQSCPGVQGDGESLTPTDIYVSEGSFDTLVPTGYLWMAERQLLSKLKDDQSLTNYSIAMQNWYNYMDGGSLDDWIEIEREVKSVVVLNNSVADSLKHKRSLISAKMDELHAYDVVLASQPVSLWSSYQAGRQDIIDDLDSLFTDYSVYEQAIRTQLIADIAVLLAQLNSYIPGNAIETDLKNLFEILLAELADNEFELDINQKAIVEGVANQCLEKYGLPVKLARAMVSTYDESLIYDDALLCASPLVSGLDEDIESRLEVFPNPTENIVYWTGLEVEHIELINPLGQIIMSAPLNTSQLDLSSFEPGVYTLRFHFQGTDILKKVIKR